MQETQQTWVWSLGQEDSPRVGNGNPSSILAGRIPWTEELGGLQFVESQRLGHDWTTEHVQGFQWDKVDHMPRSRSKRDIRILRTTAAHQKAPGLRTRPTRREAAWNDKGKLGVAHIIWALRWSSVGRQFYLWSSQFIIYTSMCSSSH